jgi:hypothetical protein
MIAIFFGEITIQLYHRVPAMGFPRYPSPWTAEVRFRVSSCSSFASQVSIYLASYLSI